MINVGISRPHRAHHQLVYLRDLLYEMVMRDIRIRYKRSVLGFLWSLLNPLAQLLVFGFVFRFILPLDIPNYTGFLFIGLIVWSWFQSSLIVATAVVVDNDGLISRPGFPASILPVVPVTTNLIHFLLALPIVLLLLFANGVILSPGALLTLPLLVALQFVFTLGLAYLLSAMHVTFRDTQYLLGIVLMLGFYLTPVFYDSSAVPERFRAIYGLNPMSPLIEGYREVLLHARAPEGGPLLLLALFSLLLVGAAHRHFLRQSTRFAEEL